MSGKRKGDYEKVLKKRKSLVPGEIQIQKMEADFEAAVWKACMTVLRMWTYKVVSSIGARL